MTIQTELHPVGDARLVELATRRPASTGAGHLSIRPASLADRSRLLQLWSDLSPSSLHRRFLTGMGDAPSASLVTHLLEGGSPGGSLLAFVGDEAVGHAQWAAVSDPVPAESSLAEIALMVADAHQGQGIGSALLAELRTQVSQRGYGSLRVVTGASNRTVVRMVHSRWPGASPVRDGTLLTYELVLPSLAGRGGPTGGRRTSTWIAPADSSPPTASAWTAGRTGTGRSGSGARRPR